MILQAAVSGQRRLVHGRYQRSGAKASTQDTEPTVASTFALEAAYARNTSRRGGCRVAWMRRAGSASSGFFLVRPLQRHRQMDASAMSSTSGGVMSWIGRKRTWTGLRQDWSEWPVELEGEERAAYLSGTAPAEGSSAALDALEETVFWSRVLPIAPLKLPAFDASAWVVGRRRPSVHASVRSRTLKYLSHVCVLHLAWCFARIEFQFDCFEFEIVFSFCRS